MSQKKYNHSAAFYDVDGTLISINIVHTYAFYASRQASVLKSLKTSALTAASLPMFAVADQISRKWFNELFYKRYKGFSRDRLEILAEELFDEVIKPNIFPRTKDLVNESKRAGVKQVLITGALDFTIQPLADYLGVDELIANSLEFKNEVATGKLKKPFVGGATKPVLMRAYAEKNSLDLARSWGYSDSYSDYPMLAVVGHPTACNPDRRLRAVARSYDWPILDLSEKR